MSRRLKISGQYAEDGRERRYNARAKAGHRCIRCGHPFETGKHGRGEWSLCDEKCTHAGPLRWRNIEYPGDAWIDGKNIDAAAGKMVSCGLTVEARWRILTVHHFDGNKSNDAWWNLLSLCQRCHLTIQSRVEPDIPWLFEHSDWLKPYVAGFYANKYENKDISREEAERRLDELLAYERKA